MTVIFSKGDFWKNGVGTPSTGFKLREYIFERILDPLQRLWREVKAFPIHPESPGKGSWNSRILSFQFSGCKTFHPVNSLFQRPWFTCLICLILKFNIARFFLMRVSCHAFDVNRYFGIMGNSGISSRCNMKRDAGTAEFGRSMELSWSDEKYSQFQGVPWMV